MTDHNLFQEVEDDLERQRFEALAKRYGPWVVAAALIIIVATAGITSWRSWQLSKNQEATAGLIHATAQPGSDSGQLMAAEESFALKNPGTSQAALAEIDAAGLAAKAGNNDRAVQLYDEVAKDQKVDPALRQLADLFSVRTQMDSAAPAALKKRLEPLQDEKAPWHFLAREYQGYLALKLGDKAEARKIFTDLAQNAEAPRTLSARAADMLRFISE